MKRRFVAAKKKLLAKLYQGCSLPANYITAKLRYQQAERCAGPERKSSNFEFYKFIKILPKTLDRS